MATTVKNRDHLQRPGLRTVDNEPRICRIKLNRRVGQIPANVSRAGILREKGDPVQDYTLDAIRYRETGFSFHVAPDLRKIGRSLWREDIAGHSALAFSLAR